MKIKNRIKELRWVKASELRPSPANWRTHPEAQKNALRAILSEIGYADVLIARELRGGALELIDGHLRAETTPDEKVPVLILDVTKKEAAKLLASLDPMAAMAKADKDKLGDLLAEIETGSDDLQKMLDDLARQEGVAIADEDGELVDAEPQLDRADELKKKWKTKSGQLWVIKSKWYKCPKCGKMHKAEKRTNCECGHKFTERDRLVHRVLCGDCRDEAAIPRVCDGEVAGCFTSPPYAEQRKYDQSSEFKPIPPGEYVGWWQAVQASVRGALNDEGSFFVNIKEAAQDGAKQTYVKRLVLEHVDTWGWQWIEEYVWPRPALPLDPNKSRRFKNGWESVYHFSLSVTYKFRPDEVRHESTGCFKYADQKAAGKMVTAKGQGVGEGVMLPVEAGAGLAYPSNVLGNMGGAKIVGHAAAFPVGLPAFFIAAFSDAGDAWLDPFLGSGTTMAAAEQLGRACFGVELSPAYVAVILQRMKDMGLTVRRAK